MQFFKRVFGRLAVLATAVVLAACGSSNNNGGEIGGVFGDAEAFIRVVHAVDDAPRVNVYLNGDLVLEDFDFRDGTAVLPIEAGTYNVRVEAIVPGGNINVIDAGGVPFVADTQTTVYATGRVANDDIAPLLIEDPTAPVAAGNFRAQVVHAAPGVGEVTVFVTAPGAAIDASANIGSFTFGQPLGPVEVPAGEYQIRVAVGNSADDFTDDDVVYDAGTVMLPEGADLQLAAVLNTTNGPSPISLVVLDGEGSSDLFDAGTGAWVRVGHVSPDTGPVDVIVNDDFMMPAVSGRVFTDVTGFLGPLPADTYNFKVVGAGTTNAAINADVPLEAGQNYTVLAYDETAVIKAAVESDDLRRVATEAKLRLFHGSVAAGNVDIYILEPDVLPSDPGIEPEPELTNVPLGADTGFLSVAPGMYDIYVTPTGDDLTLAISALDTPLAAGGVYSAIARDNTGGAGGFPLGLILFDDFDL